jgi:hypothetical protein
MRRDAVRRPGSDCDASPQGGAVGAGAHGATTVTTGAGRRIRTDDLLITNQLLYQLSYAGNNARSVAHCAVCDKRTGYERERTSTVSGSAVSKFLMTVLR